MSGVLDGMVADPKFLGEVEVLLRVLAVHRRSLTCAYPYVVAHGYIGDDLEYLQESLLPDFLEEVSGGIISAEIEDVPGYLSGGFGVWSEVARLVAVWRLAHGT